MPPKVDESKCIGCGRCVDVCLNNVLELINGVSHVEHPEKCEGCGLCEAVCPQEAIKLS
jgi:NAD-dependent dihydropyrimidine dehydrogenase PreA subunit